MTMLLRRAASIRAFDRGDTTTVLRPDGSALVFQGDSARLVREVLRALRHPLSRDGIRAHLEQVATGVAEASAAIEETLQLLSAAGAIAESAPSPKPPARPVQGHLVLGVSGAVAAVHTPALLERLLGRGFEVRVAMTRAARRFVRVEPLEALSHHRAVTSLWNGTPSEPVPHIALAEWADIVLVAPATAMTLFRLAQGSFSDVVSATALSTSAPVVVAPSMNAAMHDAPAISRNLAQLVEDGFHLLHPAVGIEVAEAPHRRKPVFGSWPALDDLVATVEFIARRAKVRADSTAPTANWDSTYRETAPGKLPFHVDQLDEDLRGILEAVPRPAALWDVGTGLGTVAREAARLGFDVIGTDVSATAIELARARSNGESARFVVDDVRRSGVEGRFDVVVDRGCLHTLDPEGAKQYAAAVRDRTKPGSLLVLKLHRAEEPRDWKTLRYPLPDLQSLLGSEFELLRWDASTLPGAEPPPAIAWLAVFRRRA